MDITKITLIVTAIAVVIYLLARGNPPKRIEFFELIDNFVSTLTDSNFKNIEKIKTEIDNKEYAVQSEFPDKKEAGELLAELNNIVKYFLQELGKNYPSDQRISRLLKKYPGTDDILEGNPINDTDSTAYSISKGEKLVICLRSKKTKKLHEKNLLMFVIIHELAHIMSESYGHNAEFYENFKFLLKQAMKYGVYKSINFTMNPKEYCGMTITNGLI